MLSKPELSKWIEEIEQRKRKAIEEDLQRKKDMANFFSMLIFSPIFCFRPKLRKPKLGIRKPKNWILRRLMNEAEEQAEAKKHEASLFAKSENSTITPHFHITQHRASVELLEKYQKNKEKNLTKLGMH